MSKLIQKFYVTDEDVTHQVKHPPTYTIHSTFTGGLKSVVSFKSKMYANKDMLCIRLTPGVREK